MLIRKNESTMSQKEELLKARFFYFLKFFLQEEKQEIRLMNEVQFGQCDKKLNLSQRFYRRKNRRAAEKQGENI